VDGRHGQHPRPADTEHHCLGGQHRHADKHPPAISHADQFDPNSANTSARRHRDAQQADLSVLESVSNATPNVGDAIIFTITLSNQAPPPPRMCR